VPQGPPTRLSVIVTCHNIEQYAAGTVISLARSRHPEIEFVLVDDASTDATPAVLEQYADRLGRTRLVRHHRSRGVSAARNTGLDIAVGKYVTFLDGDDWVASGYFPALLATIERLDCDMVRTDHVKVHGRKRAVHRIAHGPRGVVMSPREAILPVSRETSVDAPNAWAGIYHRRLADSGALRFSERLRTAEDRLWIWRMHLHVPTFAVVGLAGLFYRRGLAGSLSEVADDRQLDFIDAFAAIFAELAADPEGARFRPKAVRGYCTLVDYHLSRQDRLTPGLASRLVERCRASLRQLPADEVQAAVAAMAEARRERMATVLPG
jgi:glycosyltransferase involved in cell wall biosynthesis